MAKALKAVVKVVGAVASVLAVIPGPWQPIAAIVAVGASIASVGLEMIAPTKPKPPNLAGSQTQFRLDPNGGIPYMVGRTFFAGNVVHRDTWGTDNEYHGMSLVWSGGGPIDAIEAFQVDRATVGFNAGTALGTFAGFMWLATQLGAAPSAAVASPVAGFPGYSGQLSGYAAGAWVTKFDKNGKKFANGVPQAGIIGRGVKVYDPRKDSTYPGGAGAHRIDDEATWEFSENPWLHGLTWALGRWQNGKRVLGVGMAPEGINIPSIVDAANVADANGWKVGGMLSSTDDKWEALKSIAQAGGGQFIRMGATLTAFVNAPRVAIATITQKDIVGRAKFAGTQPIRSRINRVVPQFRSEAHGWEVIPAAPVEFAEYVAFDGDRRTTETAFGLVQDVDQVAELAAYEIVNARELGPIDLDLSIAWMGLEPGDAVNLDLPDLGFPAGTVAIVMARGIDPTTGFVAVSLKTETPGKHALALGKTTTVPATPSLVPRDLSNVRAPGAAAWALAAASNVGSNGETIPILRITGAIDNPAAEAILVRYRPSGAVDWIMGPNVDPGATKIDISGVQPGTAYEAEIAYRQFGVLGAWRALGNVATGTMTASGFVGGGALAYEDAIYFNSPRFRESLGGAVATLDAFKTSLGTAAAIAGQAAAATDPTIQPGATNDQAGDTRNSDYSPTYYRTNYFQRWRYEFKANYAVGSPSPTAQYLSFETFAPWSDTSGGPVVQRASDNAGVAYVRKSQGADGAETWSAWQPVYSGDRKPGFDGDLVEGFGGVAATLPAFKTNQGTAAAIAGQGAFATLSSAGYGSPYLTGFGGLANKNVVRMGIGYDDLGGLVDETNSYYVTNAAAITAQGTAAAIAGQGALATRGSVNLGDGTVAGTLDATRVWDGSSFLSGRWPAEFGANVTEIRTAAAIAGQGALATREAIRFGNPQAAPWGYIVDENNSFYINNANSVTAQGTAAAIAGQGALATRGTIEDGYLSGNLAARLAVHPDYGAAVLSPEVIRYRSGQGGGTLAELRPLEFGSNVTENRTAAAIAGQSAWATYANGANQPAKLEGIAANAGTSGQLRAIGSFSLVAGNTVGKFGGTHGQNQGGAVGQGLSGPAFVSSNIISAEAGGGWETQLGLDASPTNFIRDYATAAMRVIVAPGTATIVLYEFATGAAQQSPNNIPVDRNSRAMLAYDGHQVHGIIDGKIWVSLPARFPSRVYPKIFDFYNSGDNGTPIIDIIYGPYASNGVTGLRLYDAQGASYTIEGNRVAKRPGAANDWDFNVYSKETYRGGAAVSFRLDDPDTFVGLANAAPVPGSYPSNTWSIHRSSDGTCSCWYGGGVVANLGAGIPLDAQFAVVCDGYTARYYRDGVEVATSAGPTPGTEYRACVSIAVPGAAVSNIALRPFNGEIGANKTETRTSAAIAGQTAWATWTGSTNRLSRVGDDGRSVDGRFLNSSHNFGLRALSTPPTFTGSDAGGSATISIGSDGIFYPDWGGSISLPSASLPGLAYSTTYYIWRNQPDPTTAGTSYGYSTSLGDALGTGKAYLGFYTTPAAGGSGGGGGYYGGDNCVAASAFVPSPRTGKERLARNVRKGSFLKALSEDGLDPVEVQVDRGGVAMSHCVTIETESGIRLTLAQNTPMTTAKGGWIIAANVTGHRIPVEDAQGFRYERVRKVRDAGLRLVAKIVCNNGTFAAGDVAGSWIYSHNPPGDYNKP